MAALLASGIVGATALALMWGSLAGRTTHADIVPGEYSLELNITPDQADLGAQFTVNAGIFYSGQPNYQAVQWQVGYDSSLVSFVSAAKDPAAPPECSWSSDNGDSTLLGCIDLEGPNLSYSGVAWQVVYQCNNPGVAFFNLTGAEGLPTDKTFVKISTTRQAINTQGDSISCGGAPPPATPTPTVGPSESPIATPVSPGPAATPTPLPPGWEAIPLFEGCQFEAWTGASGTGAADLASLVGPPENLVALWAQQPPPLWKGYSPEFPEVSDMEPVQQLDVLAICMAGSGTFSRPII
jgi:hypothetical protein